MTFKRSRALFSITLVAAAGYASAASAGLAECKKIEAPADRLACFDRLTSRAAAGPVQPVQQPDLARATVPSQAMAAYTKAKPYEPASRWWVEAEQGFYGLSRGHAPALVVAGNPPVTGPVVTFAPIPTAPGFIGLRTEQNFLGQLNAGNATQFGGGGLDTRFHSGEALRFGYWLDPEHTQAIEGGGFYIGQGTARFSSAPGGNAMVGIPFVDANGVGQVFVVNRPLTTTTTTVFVNTTPATFVHLFDTVSTDQATGSASASYSNSLWGADLNYRLRTPLLRERGATVDVTAGLKYVNLTETLSIGSSVNAAHTDVTTFEPALGLPGTPNVTNSTNSTTATSDTIKTRNNFIGPQFGMRGDYRLDERWSVTGDARLALGANIETLSVSGGTASIVTASTTPTRTQLLAGIPLTVSNGAPVTTTTTSSSANGLFASPANAGNRTRTVFAFIPGGNFKLNYDALPNFLTLSLGYNVFWISDVLRASNQITGVGAPAFQQSDLLAQGVTLGAKVKF
jgi:hypothetical protein